MHFHHTDNSINPNLKVDAGLKSTTKAVVSGSAITYTDYDTAPGLGVVVTSSDAIGWYSPDVSSSGYTGHHVWYIGDVKGENWISIESKGLSYDPKNEKPYYLTETVGKVYAYYPYDENALSSLSIALPLTTALVVDFSPASTFRFGLIPSATWPSPPPGSGSIPVSVSVQLNAVTRAISMAHFVVIVFIFICFKSFISCYSFIFYHIGISPCSSSVHASTLTYVVCMLAALVKKSENGTTDIMATGILVGNGYVPVTTCTFRHLLTQVRLVCYSDRVDAWGTIQTIEAADVHTRQELDFFKTALYTDKDVREGFFQVAIAVFRCRDPKMERMICRSIHRGCRKKEIALCLGRRSVGRDLRD